jgi:CheY-like chemotaxis protein
MGPAPQILLIEDEPAIRRALSRFLSHKGCAVTETGDGTEALSLIAERPFDVVICDINLPGRDGTAVWRSTAKSHPQTASRFLFISALPLPDEIRRAGPRYLPKPFELPALWKEVRQILRAESHQQQQL